MASNVQENSILAQHPVAAQRPRFGASVLPEFLRSGWMLSLNSDHILVGWGEWQESDQPYVGPGTCSVFAPDFHLQAKRSWRRTPHWDLLDLERFASTVLDSVTRDVNGEEQGFQWVEPGRDVFEKYWREIQDGFQNRGLKKAVPVVFSEATARVTTSSRHKILRNLVGSNYQACNLYFYGFWGRGIEGDEGVLGATPEILFSQWSHSELETVALAGTRAKAAGPDAATQILNDPKERHEHQLVVDDVQDVLSQVGLVTSGKTEALELPTLYHLKTPVRVSLRRSLSFDDCVRILHPTPALGLAPRALGFEEINRWDEASSRSRYGAPFGVELERDDGSKVRHCVVAIRNIEWKEDRVRLGSGCGVVPESVGEREWRELQLKRESVRRILDI